MLHYAILDHTRLHCNTLYWTRLVGSGDDKVGIPHQAQISQFDLFEFIMFLKLDKQFPVDQFEATLSQSTVPSPPPSYVFCDI